MRRGSFIWLAGMALLFAAAATAQAWTAYSPDGGRFRIDMPGTPKVTLVPITSGAQSSTMTESTVELPGAAYLASWIDYPDRVAQAHAADVLLDRARDGMAAGQTLRGERKLTLGRAAGRAFTITEANGNSHAVRIYFARNRLYTLSVSGRTGIETQPDTQRYFDSFTIIRAQT